MLDTSLDSFNFYFLVAVLQGFVLSLIIIFRRPVKKPNVYYGLVVWLSSLSLLHGVLEKSIHAFNAIFPFPMEYGFAIGPLTYFHFKYIVDPNFKFTFRHISHFFPSLLIDFIFFLVFFTYARTHLHWANENVQNIQMLFLLIGMLFLLQMTLYIVSIYRIISQTEFKPKEYAKHINSWFKISISLGVIIVVLHVIAIPTAIMNIALFDEHSYMIYNPLGIIKSVSICGLGYLYLLKYMNKLNRYLERADNMKFSTKEVAEKKQQLMEIFEREEIYKEEKLNVDKLAQYLGWSARDVPIIIGEAFNTNFNDLINTYRVKAFKDLATKSESKKYSIMGIAQEVGFNSKASFYRAFKKECGQTPSEFLNQNTSDKVS